MYTSRFFKGFLQHWIRKSIHVANYEFLLLYQFNVFPCAWTVLVIKRINSMLKVHAFSSVQRSNLNVMRFSSVLFWYVVSIPKISHSLKINNCLLESKNNAINNNSIAHILIFLVPFKYATVNGPLHKTTTIYYSRGSCTMFCALM